VLFLLLQPALIISNFDLQTEAEQQYKSDLKANLYLDDRRLTSGAKLGLTVEIINSSSIKQSLRFNSSQIYNIIIKDKNDQVVYSWAEDKLFAQSFRDIEIEAKEALYFEEKILLPELSRGDYYIMVEIKSIEKEISSKSKKLIID